MAKLWLMMAGWAERVVGGETHPDRGKTRHCLQKQLEVVVRSFSLPTPCLTLTGKQKGGHVLGQVRQRHQLLRQRSQKLADVITSRYTVLGKHDVRRKVREGGSEGVFIGRAKACQQNGGEDTAGKAVVVILCDRHAVNVDDSRRGIVGVSLEHVEGWASSINRWLAGGFIDGVGKVYRHSLPFFVRHHVGEGTRDVMHGAHA